MPDKIKMMSNRINGSILKKTRAGLYFSLFLSLLTSVGCQQSLTSENKGAAEQGEPYSAYLFTYFTGNGPGEEAIRYAISLDGLHYKALNNNEPIISSAKISSSGGVRDPHILRGADGKTFYMVVTDLYVPEMGWNLNSSMVLMKSTDLINWTSTVVNIPETFARYKDINRVWAPQTIYDPKEDKYMLYWSMRFGQDPDIIYYAYANEDFTGLESAPKQLFYHPQGKGTIDGDIVYKDGKYHMFFKTEGAERAGIKKAVSDKLTEGYVMVDEYLEQTNEAVEGSGIFKLNNSDTYILMYDVYKNGKYQFTKSKDLRNFTVIDEAISMDFHPRHGSVLPITATEAERLVTRWMSPADVLKTAQSKAIKKRNIVLDTAAAKLFLPVKAGTDLKSFDPEFVAYPGVEIRPSSAVDFTEGPVEYTVKIEGKEAENFEVIFKEWNNPVLEGFYADPDVMYSEKTGKYYIYPTSDGFHGWSGTYFKVFSSDNLADWKDEGVILDLKKDVSWADRNAWAPAIIEKKIGGAYKYFYYFTAAQKIGVAVADHPTGPFVDSGRPLIAAFPEGVSRGQQIDPDVFTDPKTGKSYLYWGNGYMAGAELNDDMISLKPGTTKVMTPDATFREGAHVLYRNGTYYFMWSENDTRSEDYRVRYGTSDSPLGKITIPENNLVIAKDKEAGIYGTGHHSVIQVPGTDEWYIVYHRFNYPKGITMGDAAGYNREVSIDKLEFNKDGSIQKVKPSHKGISLPGLN